MATMTAPAVRPAATSPWTASLYAGIFTAIAAAAFTFFFARGSLWLYGVVFLLFGVAPVLGYQLAAGRLGTDWVSILGGLLGFIVLVLGFILWPILVGVMTRGQSVAKLFLWSVVGFILGLLIMLVVGTFMGQSPGWVAFGWTLGWAVWGGTVGAAMTDSNPA